MIRLAALEDSERVWNMLLEHHARQGWFRFAPQKVIAMLTKAITENRVYVADKDGTLVGTCAWEKQTTYFSDEEFIGDLWIYVRPRSGYPHAALFLKRALQRTARSLGLPLMTGIVGPEQEATRLFDKDPAFITAGKLFFMRK